MEISCRHFAEESDSNELGLTRDEADHSTIAQARRQRDALDAALVEPEMLRVTKVSFEDPVKGDALELALQQIIEDDYGFYIWPSARVLAEFLWRKRAQLKGRRVLELGAGTSLPGLLCAACGARVTLTDRHDSPRVLQNMKSCVTTNKAIHFKTKEGVAPHFIDATVVGLSYAHFTPSVHALGPFDLIIGADLFYDNDPDYDSIMATVTYFMRQNPRCSFLLAYQIRSSKKTAELQTLFEQWRVQAELLRFDFDSQKYFESKSFSDGIVVYELKWRGNE